MPPLQTTESIEKKRCEQAKITEIKIEQLKEVIEETQKRKNLSDKKCAQFEEEKRKETSKCNNLSDQHSTALTEISNVKKEKDELERYLTDEIKALKKHMEDLRKLQMQKKTKEFLNIVRGQKCKNMMRTQAKEEQPMENEDKKELPKELNKINDRHNLSKDSGTEKEEC